MTRPDPAARPRLGPWDLVAASVVGLFLLASAFRLGTWPPVHEDEAWEAEPGWVFWQTGRFASELFRGFGGSELHDFAFPPLYPMAVGAALSSAGVSLTTSRAVSLAFGAAALVATHLLGRRLFSARHGAIAALFLAAIPIAEPSPFYRSGIPLFDLARLTRYDVAVPVFGLLALWVLAPVFRGEREPTPWRGAMAGGLTAMAALAHLHGAAWLAAAVAALFVTLGTRATRAAVGAAGTFLLLFGLWPAWILLHPSDALEQLRNYAPRLQVTSPGYLFANVAHEVERFSPVKAALANGRPGAVVGVAFAAAGSLLLLRGFRRNPAARALVAAGATLSFSFALLLTKKHHTYAVALWPFAALAAAMAASDLWDRGGRFGKGLLVAALAIAFAGTGLAAGRFVSESGPATPYAVFGDRLLAVVQRGPSRRPPAHPRVLAMQHWWFALATQADVRSWLVPVFLTNVRYVAAPLSFADAVRLSAPDLVVVDPTMRTFLSEGDGGARSFAPLAREIRAWLGERATLRIALLSDPTYGDVEVFQVSASPGAPSPERPRAED